ncbi:hypothetical protein V6N12_036481 [Hibiscus sabdariffa]|uniref:UBC core domain-containing protein n=1 Tax=Hibiscus sabdariffa TaxID=183260 RepID=A0ABR2EQU5_9ROSI
MEIIEDVVIVGAGIAGLTTSLGLHRLGIRSLVLESSERLRLTGFALNTWTNAWKALDAVGIGESLRHQHHLITSLLVTSTSLVKPASEISFQGHEIRCLERRLLLETLANELPDGTIRFSSKVVSIDESASYFKRLHLADGTIIKTKVLVGCDGVNSVVAKWLGFKNPSFTGRSSIRGNANFKGGHGFGTTFRQFFGNGVRAGLVPWDDENVYWFFTWTPATKVEKEMEDNPIKLKQLVRSKLNDKSDEMRSVVEKTSSHGIILSPIRYRKPWELLWGNINKGNVCVAGDALHPMTPDIGQGGCSALEDGVVLARCLGEALLKPAGKAEEEYERIETGLKRFAKERRWRSFDLIATAFMVGYIQQKDEKVQSLSLSLARCSKQIADFRQMEKKQQLSAFETDESATASLCESNTLSMSDSTTNGPVSDQIANNPTNVGVSKQNEASSNSHRVPYIYRQDVVKSNTNGSVGIVSEVAGDSDSDGSITDDEDDEDEDNEHGEDESGDVDANSNANESGEGNKVDHEYKCGDLQADQIRVLWMDDTEPVQSIKNVTVVDRGFLHGDYVAAASDSTGQVGVVVDVNISVDLLAPDGSTIKDIPTRDLQRVRDFAVGDYVVLGPWLGRIDDVLDNVNVLFDDGSECKVMRAEPLRLKPITRNTLEDDSNFPYYPGQRVRASSSTVFKNSRWLSGLWKPNRLEGTVTKVTAGSVFIYWIASAGYGPDSSTAPAEEQNPKNLKLLSCFTHVNWQVGDWCLLPTSSQSIPLDKGFSKLKLNGSKRNRRNPDCDSEEMDESNDNTESMDLDDMPTPFENNAIVGTKANGTIENKVSLESSSCSSSLSVSKETVHEHWPLHRKKVRKVVIRKDKKAKKKGDNFERALLIVNSRTRVGVAWQDGIVERGVDATKLIPIETPGDHEFVAEQYVVEKTSDDGDDTYEPRRVGVVKSVNAKERTACVKWLKPVARAEDPREFDKEEIVSVYELEGHPDYDYCYGDVVVRLPPAFPVQSVSVSEEGSLVEPKPEDALKELKRDFKRNSGNNKVEGAPLNETSIDFTDLSWVGNITGLKNGDIEVTWADGMVSLVGPQAIYVVGRDDDESIAAGSEVSDDAASWETVNDDEMDGLENAQEDLEPQKASGIVSETEEGRQKNVDPTDLDSEGETEHEPEGRCSSYESSSQKSNVTDNSGGRIVSGKGQEYVEVEAQKHSLPEEDICNLRIEDSDPKTGDEDDACSLKRFDTAKDPLDHYFLGANGQNNNGRKWLKKVQQDWNILQNNLPDGIYVRVYEDRMDLLRAVIVGAYGTPYQDGLFFFDFHLPPEYPDVPPSAYYHSGGWRLNPNLYEEGKVCLSLLNTWTGRGNEVWDPSSSSILQVLVSLQGLVLNARPYFNEAGYDKQVGTAEGEKNSLAYNENTFLLNCKSMMHLLRKPPKDFEELVKDHFRRRGYYILKACDAYMKGYLIGSLTKDASISDANNADSNSVGFKLMLGKIVPKLLLALNEAGADCQEFKHLQQS